MRDFSEIQHYFDFIGLVGNDSDSDQLTIVYPDNSLILGFQLGADVYERLDDKKQLIMTASGVCGQLTKKKEYLNTPHSQTLLVKFKPWAARFFFDGIEGLTNQNTDLSCLVTRDLHEETLERFNNETDKLNTIKSFLLRQFNPDQVNPSMFHAIQLIEQAEGKIRVDSLANEICCSKRNFERKFKAAVGLSPKKFISNVRFQHSLQCLQTNTDLQQVAFSSGYYDLPHFINDFKSVTGTTPEKFIR